MQSTLYPIYEINRIYLKYKQASMTQEPKSYIKINLEHNLSSLKIPELKVDPQMTILALKEAVERRYGSEPPYVKLTLKNKEGQNITNLEEEMRSLSFYNVENGMIVHIMDLNPNSIHNQIENVGQIQKYVMSDETYDQLPENFRKWKKKFMEQHPGIKNQFTGEIQICDPDYLKSLTETMSVGQRCQLENGARGEIRYIGRALEVGFGYFVGIELDQPVENAGNGTLQGMHYFFSEEGKAVFLRPNKIQVGEFPKIEQNDQI